MRKAKVVKELKQEIYFIVRNDIDLRAKLAKKMNIQPESVYKHAFKKTHSLSKDDVVKVISDYVGKPMNEMFENKKVDHKSLSNN